MVLTDDHFTSIFNAVEEEREIFDDVQKIVRYLLATNTGEVLLIFFATLACWPSPMRPIQLLWINLLRTDSPPSP